MGVIAPHMDDAALSCGQLLAAHPGSHVVTVFSSGPASVRPLPSWDALSGFFQPGDNVMAMRAGEDDDAMAVVGAQGHRLGFWDEQYRQRPVRLARLRRGAVRAAQRRLDDPSTEREVERRLTELVGELAVGTWLVPLGLWHGDHKKTARACLKLASRMRDRQWVVYEELPYNHEVPGEVSAAKQRVEANGFVMEPAASPPGEESSKKRSMIDCYRSQLPCLGARIHVAVSGPEVFYLLRAHA